MPLNSVFHIMIFDIITKYENKVFNTLLRSHFINTYYLEWFVRYDQLYHCIKLRACHTLAVFQRTHSVMNNKCFEQCGIRYGLLMSLITSTLFYLLQ